MKITNPRPESARNRQAPTRDEVVLGAPTISGVTGGVDFGGKPMATPLGAVPPRPGLNDTPLNIRERQDR